MAIYTNAAAVAAQKHGLFRSSRLKSTDIGKILDLVINDGASVNPQEIAVDRGVAVKAGDRINDGLQLRKGTVAGIKDKVYIVGNPAIIKEATNRFQEEEFNYYVKAGEVVKAYEVLGDLGEVFGVAAYQFTTLAAVGATTPTFGNYVVLDGTGGYVELAAAPTATDYGFIGKVYGFETGDNETIVLIECIQNEQRA